MCTCLEGSLKDSAKDKDTLSSDNTLRQQHCDLFLGEAETEGERERETDRQTDRQTDRHRQTNRIRPVFHKEITCLHQISLVVVCCLSLF